MIDAKILSSFGGHRALFAPVFLRSHAEFDHRPIGGRGDTRVAPAAAAFQSRFFGKEMAYGEHAGNHSDEADAHQYDGIVEIHRSLFSAHWADVKPLREVIGST